MRAPDDQAVSVGVFGLGHAAVVVVWARRNARFTTLSLPFSHSITKASALSRSVRHAWHAGT